MSVVSCRRSSRPARGTFELGQYVIYEYWTVIVSSLSDTPLVVTAATGLPRLFDLYTGSAIMRARSFEAEQTADNSLVWNVTVIYRTPDLKEGQRGDFGGTGRDSGGGTGRENATDFNNPLSELPKVKFSTTSKEDAVTQIYDVNAGILKPVTASNGELFDPPPKKLTRGIGLEISRNEDISAPHPLTALTYVDAVNSDTWWGLPPGSWLCVSIGAERAERQVPGGAPIPYLSVVYSFEARAEWDIVILDSGSYYNLPSAASTSNPFLPLLAPSNLWVPFDPVSVAAAAVTPTAFRRRQFQSAEGHPVHAPLNGQGGALPSASTFTSSTSTNRLTVPAPATASPGVYVNGIAVQVWATGGTLPAPLSPLAVYYTVNVNLDDNSFQLTANPNTQQITVSGCSYSAAGGAFINAAAGRFVGVAIGMRVFGRGIPASTTVTSAGSGTATQINLSATPTETVTSGTVIFYGVAGTVTITSDGTGTFTVKPLGVFLRVRPYNRVPFGALGLPQSFLDVQ